METANNLRNVVVESRQKIDETLELHAAMLPHQIAFANNIPKPSTWKQGGIDLNTSSSSMYWKTTKDGNGVEMNVDPAILARISLEGVNSLSPLILRVTQIMSIWPLVGLLAPTVQN
jgi:hypothetical protein